MGRKKIAAKDSWTWNDWTEGTTLEGVYQATRTVEKDFEEGTKKVIKYEFRRNDGRLIEFWGSAVLNAIMEQAKPGDHMWITYDGEEEPYKKGMLPKRLFSAEIEDGADERAAPEDNIAAGDDEKPIFGSKGEVANG